nr:DUF3344 domain-containing protein [candidate division Zixibacteria bacterium]NIR94104.1 DUF3344 domain-containing protein [Gammaproteobacteria bacterium]NIR67150.1 DUF3344 domain-containing protein [candidate division Zixibacteria bacterium]NIS48581.1 DUF3344 domain-containing protein [candidate division Zixibacteria bacterium]NIU16659.1 DUF3344 domain-containing protein [candidate division Zixibacteria bacterium]
MNTQVDWSNWRRRLINISIVAAVILLLSVSSATSVLADGNNELNESFKFSVHGDVVAAGVGLRGTGTGIIQVDGIPTGATVERAFLYWATIGDSTDYEVTLDEEPVVDELIGTTGNTCWFNGDYDNFVFRADVTGLIPNPGNGAYTIDGLPDDLRNTDNDSQGASLVIVYSHPSAELRTIIFNDGAVSLKEDRPSYTHFIDGFEITDSINDAHITYIIGDGQEDDGISDYTSGAVLYNGGLIGTDIFDGTDGAYWDTYTMDVSSLTDESPANTTVNY